MSKLKNAKKSRQSVAPKKVLRLKKPIILTQKASNMSEIKFRRLVENMNEAVWMGDRHERTIYANPKFCKIMGYKLEEMIGRESYDFWTEESIQRVKEVNVTDRKAGVSSSYEGELLTKSGKEISVLVSGTPLPDGGTIGIITDLTAVKKAEKALQESKDKYCTIFENTGSATIIIEGDTTLSLVNTEFEKISGYSKKETEGKKSWTEFFAKEDIKRMMKYHKLRRINPKDAPRNYPARLVDRKGNIKYLYITVDLIPGTKKSVASFLDITAQKKAAKSLENRLREFQVLYQINAHTRMVTPLKDVWKDVVKDLTLACDEIKPARARIVFDNKVYTNLKKKEEFLSRIEEPLMVFGAKRGIIELGYVEKIADKDSFHLKQEKKVLHIAAQTLGKHIQSREIMERYQKVVKKSVTGIYIVENDVIRYANPKFYKLFKYKESEVVGQPIDKFLIDCKYKILLKYPEKGTLHSDIKGRKKNGTIISLQSVTQLIDYHGKAAVLGRVHDVTKLKEAEARLKNFNKELKQKITERTKDLEKANRCLQSLNELKDEFIAVTSHELRSPLTAIRGYLSFLVDEGLLSKMPEEAKNYLIRVNDNATVLNNLVNNILDVSRIETNRFELRRTPVDIANLLQKVIRNFSFQAQERKLDIQFINKLKEPVILNVDEIRIQQVLRNILDNAIKYTMKGKGIAVEIEMKGIGVQVAIIDEGVGIPKSQIFEIFDKFKQAKNSLTRFKGGAGLGLFISKKIIELHGGMIWAESQVRKGTTFRIQLPID